MNNEWSWPWNLSTERAYELQRAMVTATDRHLIQGFTKPVAIKRAIKEACNACCDDREREFVIFTMGAAYHQCVLEERQTKLPWYRRLFQ